MLPRRLAQLPDERHVSVAVDRHDRRRAGVLDDLALVAAPFFDNDVEELPVVHPSRFVRLRHDASLSTRRRSSLPYQSGACVRACTTLWTCSTSPPAGRGASAPRLTRTRCAPGVR